MRNLLEVEGKQRFLPKLALSIVEGAVMTSASGLRETAPPPPLEESTSFPPNSLMRVSAIVKFPRHEVSDRRELSSSKD